MPRLIFVSLPVHDVAVSRRFYESLGFAANDMFSDDTSACIVISDTIYVMLSSHHRYAALTTLPIANPRKLSMNLMALSCEEKAEVDSLVTHALAAGGSEPHPPEDLGFMYSRAFADPDGHGWGPFWMDPAAAASGPPDMVS